MIQGVNKMEIKSTKLADELTLELSGNLDTMTAPKLEETIKNELTDVKSLIFDLKDLEYISSAGLRVLLKAQKAMNANGGAMKILSPSELVMEVFDVTGFADILTIE